jgi:hypothetical protein
MIWFGSSAGVALASKYPEARSVFAWLKAGWHVALAYVVSYLVMVAVLGWHPDAKLRDRTADAATIERSHPAAPTAAMHRNRA